MENLKKPSVFSCLPLCMQTLHFPQKSSKINKKHEKNGKKIVRFWDPLLEPSWELLGLSWEGLGPLLGPSWQLLAALGRPRGLLGRLLAASDEAKNCEKSAGVRILASLCRFLGLFLVFLAIFIDFWSIFIDFFMIWGRFLDLPGTFPPTFLAKLIHQVSRNMCGTFSMVLRHRFAGSCWELGTPTDGCNRWGPSWGAAVSAKRSTIFPLRWPATFRLPAVVWEI